MDVDIATGGKCWLMNRAQKYYRAQFNDMWMFFVAAMCDQKFRFSFLGMQVFLADPLRGVELMLT